MQRIVEEQIQYIGCDFYQVVGLNAVVPVLRECLGEPEGGNILVIRNILIRKTTIHESTSSMRTTSHFAPAKNSGLVAWERS